MRWMVISLTAAVALVGATIAFASESQGDQGGAAFALVDPDGGSPRLITAHSSGFVAVSVGNAGQGDYCLTPASGVDVAPAAVVSEEAFYSSDAGFPTVRYDPQHTNCTAKQLEVKTFAKAPDGAISLSGQIAFTVNVP